MLLVERHVSGKKSSPALQNETQNMNTTENLIATGSPPQSLRNPRTKIVKPIKFPPQPQEWKTYHRNVPHPGHHATVRNPGQAAAYWRTHIATHPYFNPECECLVVLILNTRRRIRPPAWCPLERWILILVILGGIRLAIMASAATNHHRAQSSER